MYSFPHTHIKLTRYHAGLRQLLLTDTIIEFMGGVRVFIPRDIDRRLQMGPIKNDPVALQDATNRVWSLIIARVKEKLRKFPGTREDTLAQVMALKPDQFDAYLLLLEAVVPE